MFLCILKLKKGQKQMICEPHLAQMAAIWEGVLIMTSSHLNYTIILFKCKFLLFLYKVPNRTPCPLCRPSHNAPWLRPICRMPTSDWLSCKNTMQLWSMILVFNQDALWVGKRSIQLACQPFYISVILLQYFHDFQIQSNLHTGKGSHLDVTSAGS